MLGWIVLTVVGFVFYLVMGITGVTCLWIAIGLFLIFDKSEEDKKT